MNRKITKGAPGCDPMEAGRRFLDEFQNLVRQEGLTPERLALLFAGFDMLRACLPPTAWQQFVAETDAHPMNALLFEKPAGREERNRRGRAAIRRGPAATAQRRIAYR